MLILKAINFAIKKHEGQYRRSSGADYVTHPIYASYLLPKYKKSKNLDKLIIALLLHDVVEDTNTTIEEIYENFGKMVGDLVSELTSDKEKIKLIGKKAYIKKRLLELSSYGLVLKLIDRLVNILDNPREQYVNDTIESIIYLEKNRELTRTQRLIVADILLECYKIKV